jgi:hypothetical protein
MSNIWQKTFSSEEVLTMICMFLVQTKFEDEDGDITAEMDNEGNVTVYMVEKPNPLDVC